MVTLKAVKDLLVGGQNYDPKDPLVISPTPDLLDPSKYGECGVDLRLGSWMAVCKRGRHPMITVTDSLPESIHMRSYYARFGHGFVLHPQHFILGVTLEWLRMPQCLGAYVIGKSSWGRRGLIIATATGVHPGFTGSLTLEITNLGEVPIEIFPGMSICQLFCHSVLPNAQDVAIRRSGHYGSRKPRLSPVAIDDVATKLRLGSLEGALSRAELLEKIEQSNNH